jgi:hypothetical protein
MWGCGRRKIIPESYLGVVRSWKIYDFSWQQLLLFNNSYR